MISSFRSLCFKKSQNKPTYTLQNSSALLLIQEKFVHTNHTSQHLKTSQVNQPHKKPGNFIDTKLVHIRAGNGGNGARTFEPSSSGDTARNRPDGGHGGNGGSVYVCTSPTLRRSLSNISSHLTAENGTQGRSGKRSGRNGHDLIINVPIGTAIYLEEETNLKKQNFESISSLSDPTLPTELSTDEVLAKQPRFLFFHDLESSKEPLLVERGGQGAPGNAGKWIYLPEEYFQGQKKEIKRYFFILKILADCGFVGPPNAGKSSLLNSLTKAKSQVAAYPFTTLAPHLGTVEYPSDAFQLTIADIPGIIEDAHQNRGLGLDFLKHISRSRILLYVLDMSGQEDRDPLYDLKVLQNELHEYDPELLLRPSLIIANKMDLPSSKRNYTLLKAATHLEIIPCSAKNKIGLDILKKQLRNYVELST